MSEILWVRKFGPLYEGENELIVPARSAPVYVDWQVGGHEDGDRRVFVWMLCPYEDPVARTFFLLGTEQPVSSRANYVGTVLGPGRKTGEAIHVFDMGEV